MPRRQPAAAEAAYLSRGAALERLGVKPQTLYAYVSRGLIRSIRAPEGGNTSVYRAEDVERMRRRGAARTEGMPLGPAAWREPVIPSSITEITPQGPRYRGRAALSLVEQGAAFEQVAELLWTGLWYDDRVRWPAEPLPSDLVTLLHALPADERVSCVAEVFALVATRLGMVAAPLEERLRDEAPVHLGRRLVRALAACLGLLGPTRSVQPPDNELSVAHSVLRNLGVEASPAARRATDGLLTLIADHELASPAFAARVAASSGTLLGGCVAAALLTHGGLHVGRIQDRIEQFVRATPAARDLLAQVRDQRAAGRAVPGFNHPLYPQGDPRAEYLLAVAAAWPHPPGPLLELLRFLQQARDELQLQPRIEYGVMAVALALGLPAGSPGAVFLLARVAGWAAHVMEQRTAGYMVRPRARYVEAGG